MIQKFWAVLLCLVMVLTMMPAMVFAADSPDSTQFTGADGVNSFNAAPDTSSGESGCSADVKEGGDTPSEAADGTQKNSDVDADEDDLEGGNTPAKKEAVKAGYSANTTGLKGSNTVTNYDLWVGDTQVTSENADNILGSGTVSYDAESNILMLNGANLTNGTHSGNKIAATIFADDSIGTLTVHVTGENKIDVTQFGTIAAGIYAYNDIIFEGDGDLSVSALSLGSEGNAVYSHTGNVTINSGAYSFTGDGTGSYGIFANSNSGTVYVNGGTLTVSAGQTGQNGVAIGGNLDFSNYGDCEITASVNAGGTPETTYIPDNQNTYRLYKYIRIEPKIVVTPEYDENGFQINGDGYQPAEEENGIYQIKNAGNLFWFAQEVKSSGEGTVMNAELANDIAIPEGRSWTPIAVDKQSTTGVPYTGTFNGNGHAISGLKTETKHGGLFKSLGKNSVVKNLGIIDSAFEGGNFDYVGAIAATNYGTIENCYNTSGVTGWGMFVGGIVGENKGTIKECYNTGTITGNGQGEGIGGICGVAREMAVIENCYNTGSISGRWGISGICGYFDYATIRISNCYNTGKVSIVSGGYEETVHGIAYANINYHHDETDYLAAAKNCYYLVSEENQSGGKTSEQFASGEVAYLLNGGQSDGVWGQTIGTQSGPVLNGKAVYAGYEYCYSDSITYSNNSEQVHETKPEHNFAKLEYDGTSHWYSCANDGCTATNGKEDHKGGTATYFNKAVCEVCKQEYGELLTDSTPPTGEISVGANKWLEFTNTITFDLFFKNAQTVEITADDDSYDHAGYTEDNKVKIEYYLHTGDTALTKEELNAKTFAVYTGSFDIAPDNQYVMYVKLTDHAGNTTYINSDGIVLDGTAPAITGVTDGNTYYTTQSVTASDDNLASVTVNGSQVNDAFDLQGNTDVEYSIVATDKAGNSITYTVAMKPIESLADAIEGITTDNVTSEDKAAIEAVKEDSEAVNADHATDEEKAELTEILDNCTDLLARIEESAQAGNTENIDKVEDITVDNVKLEDKDDLNSAKEDLENALDSFSGNYTEAEKTALEEKLDRINSALDSIENAEKAEEAISSLPDQASPDDTDAEKLINDVKKQYDALTDHEKSLVSKAAKAKLESLLDDLKDYKIIKGDGSIWTKGTERGLEFTANGSYSKFAGIEVDGETVNEENYTAISGSTVITLKPEYLETLSVGRHTLTVLYTDGKAGCGFEIRAKADTAAQTGDESNMSIRIALAVLAALGAAGALLYGRQRKMQ